MSRRFSFIFICQAGALERQALLLAASLKRNLRCDHELVAAVPSTEQWGSPQPATLDLLRQWSVRTVPISNDVDPTYPIGNKISCLRVPTEADRQVFLDTDTLLSREFHDEPRFATPFVAKPADLPSDLSPRQWKRAYAADGVRPPGAWVATTVHGRVVLPYFNAGFVAVDAKAGLGDAWLECCRKIDAKWGIPQKRPHLDQIALAVAIRRLGLPFDCLDERYNFPVNLKPIDHGALPILSHYHGLSVLRREPALVDLVRSLCEEHPALAEILRSDEEYAPMLAPQRGAAATVCAPCATEPGPCCTPAARTPELIITGIPRSGTSYLSNLLHRYENCVVLNEPDAIARPLRKELIPYGVGTFYRNIRRDVMEGQPVRNKLRDGKVTDETVGANDLVEYVPKVASGDFVLGVKNPLGFLGRLHDLRRAMPRARVVLCVRNPYDTIASWKTTFSHLKSADVAGQTFGGLRDAFLSPRNRTLLREIARIKSDAWRRAAWWRYLAEQVLDAVQLHGGSADVLLVPYPQAVTDPQTVIGRILDGFNTGTLREPIEPSSLRAAKRSVLDAEDVQAIRALCNEGAAALGVAEDWAEEADAVPSTAPAKSMGAELARPAAAVTLG